ncbi:hypothetical protein [Paraburkholderia sp. GAS348]|uniref:hypothetical protein n=1 Tax=Paraburkholderia sp. GAS348 TaxID=3035132 RepID=UPI003D23D04A
MRSATSEIERDLESATSTRLHLQQPEASRGTIHQTFLVLGAHFFNALQMTLSEEDPEGKRFRHTMRRLLVAAIPATPEEARLMAFTDSIVSARRHRPCVKMAIKLLLPSSKQAIGLTWRL